MNKKLPILIVLFLLVLPLSFAIDTTTDGSNVGTEEAYINYVQSLIRGAFVPQVVLDSVDYNCNTQTKSGAIATDSNGNFLITNTNPPSEWIRLDILDSKGYIKDSTFLKKGTSYNGKFVANSQYTFHVFKCTPKEVSVPSPSQPCAANDLVCIGTYGLPKTPVQPLPTQPSQPSTPTKTDENLPPLKKFVMSDLKKITNFDEFTMAGKVNIVLTNEDVYSFKVKNFQKKTSSAKVEAYYVSKSNPFATKKISELKSSGSLFPLQAAIADSTKLTTCKGNAGTLYDIPSLLPNEEKIIYIQPNHPSKNEGKSIEGAPQYDSNGEYLLVVSLIDGCTNGEVYDEIGGTINFQVAGGTGKGGNPITGEIPETTLSESLCNPETNCPKKPTISEDKADDLTSKDLLIYQCSSNSECSNKNCKNFDSLVDDGILTESKANSYTNAFETTITGAGVGASGGLILCAAGVTTAIATSALTVGAATPLVVPLAGLCAGTGTVLGGLTGYWTKKSADAAKSKDLASIGLCMEEEDSDFSLGDFIKDGTSTVGKEINKAFGTKYNSLYLGTIILGIILFFIFTKK